jgi:hypothetical protein
MNFYKKSLKPLLTVVVGQMLKMIAQVCDFKDYIFCNYANILDDDKCGNVACVTTATNSNCK